MTQPLKPLQDADTIWIVAYKVSDTLWQHRICTSRELADSEFEYKKSIYTEVDLLVWDRRA